MPKLSGVRGRWVDHSWGLRFLCYNVLCLRTPCSVQSISKTFELQPARPPKHKASHPSLGHGLPRDPVNLTQYELEQDLLYSLHGWEHERDIMGPWPAIDASVLILVRRLLRTADQLRRAGNYEGARKLDLKVSGKRPDYPLQTEFTSFP